MRFLTQLSLMTALLFFVPLSAHDGHRDNMSDAEMVAMEHDMSASPAMHDDGDAGIHVTVADKHEHGAQEDGHDADATSTMTHQTMSSEQMMQQKIEENRLTSASDLLGRLHPIAAHFPIALLLVAALAELALMMRPGLGIEATTRFLVAGGAVGAVSSAILGWFAAGWRLLDRSEYLALHRWNGTSIAALSLLAWWLATRGKDRLRLRVVLVVIVAGLVAQGYLGGEMVFGPNHMGLM